eukprot:767974-Hanusia_phi.AAC.6
MLTHEWLGTGGNHAHGPCVSSEAQKEEVADAGERASKAEEAQGEIDNAVVPEGEREDPPEVLRGPVPPASDDQSCAGNGLESLREVLGEEEATAGKDFCGTS